MLGKFITHCEDSLTAAVFTHLLHLPTEVYWKILMNACYTDKLPESPGEPLLVDFWPKWDPTDTFTNNTYVEPDIFMRFARFDLIIEAKRWDEAPWQDRGQWKREHIAYLNEYGEEKRLVKMVALGGIRTTLDDVVKYTWFGKSVSDPNGNHDFECPVFMCKWGRLLLECQRMRKELQRLKYPCSQTRANLRILANLVDLFACHSFSTGSWFEDFNFYKNSLSPAFSSHLQLFKNRSKQLSAVI